MKASIAASAGFTGQRMIQDYLEFYDQFSQLPQSVSSNSSAFPLPLFPEKARTRAAMATTPISNVRVSVITDDLESDVSVFSHGRQAATGHG